MYQYLVDGEVEFPEIDFNIIENHFLWESCNNRIYRRQEIVVIDENNSDLFINAEADFSSVASTKSGGSSSSSPTDDD